jgi:S1-C subfamily serine protease
MQPFFQEDSIRGSADSPWESPARAAHDYPARSPGDPRFDAYTADRKRLRRLLWLLGILIIVILTPLVVGRVTYEYVYNRELAEVQVAKEQLGELELEGLSLASRLIAAGVGPSVVHIRSTQVVMARNALDDEREFLWGDPEEFEREGEGSGVIVDEAGYIVTNHHVVAGAETIKVVLSDGREAIADVIGGDEVSDVAVIKIDLPDLHPAEWGDSDKLEIGDLVWAMGSPFGLKQSTTFGIISAKDRRNVSQYQDFIQTDAAVNPGNSGGPLVGTHGKIVGINTAIVGPTFRGISFAIPSNTAHKVYETVRENGEVVHGWLGVSLGEMTPQLAEQLEVPAVGAIVGHVWQNSPAMRAGLQTADVITHWGGKAISDPTDLTHLVVGTPVGTEVAVDYLRGGRERTTKVTVGKRPPFSKLRR